MNDEIMKDKEKILSYIRQVEESTALLYDEREKLNFYYIRDKQKVEELNQRIEFNEGIIDALKWVIGKKDVFDWY